MKKKAAAKILSLLLALALCLGMTPTAALAAGFTDLSNHWAKEHIVWAVEKELFNGVSADRFDPNGTMTRAMAVTVLHRLAGRPEASAAGKYLDVADGKWYSDAVAWADENKIVTGYGAGKFGPFDPVTREQLVTFLFRYAGYAELNTAKRDDLSRYSDAGAVSRYAKEAFQWAVSTGVVSGKTAVTLDPKGKATRAEVAVVLRRLDALPAAGEEESSLAAVLEEVGQLVYRATPQPAVGSVGGEWAVLGLARSGCRIPQSYYDGYYARLENTVNQKKGVLSDRKNTEYSRVILAVLSIGKDPENVAGYDLTKPLENYEQTAAQGINGPIWALIALDAAGSSSDVKEKYISRILEKQLPGGGWAISGTAFDPDTTAMALQALAKYQSRTEVSEAVGKALAAASKQQSANGGYASWGTDNAESCAQMIVALCQLGIPLDDPRFVKNGSSLLTHLMSFYLPGQGFAHESGSTVKNQMATEQAFYALVAAWRAETGKPGLYDMK